MTLFSIVHVIIQKISTSIVVIQSWNDKSEGPINIDGVAVSFHEMSR